MRVAKQMWTCGERRGKRRGKNNGQNIMWRYVSPQTESLSGHDSLIFISAMFLDPSLNPHCRECNSMDVDTTFLKAFNCLVCKKCQNEKPEKYSLLTKTECKEVYI